MSGISNYFWIEKENIIGQVKFQTCLISHMCSNLHFCVHPFLVIQYNLRVN